MNNTNVDMQDVFEYLIKDIPTWKVVLIDKWTDFKVWVYSLFISCINKKGIVMTNEVFETIKAIITCVFCTLIGFIGGYLMRHIKD